MAEISVITFKRGINKEHLYSLPSCVEHWGIYVEYEKDNTSQMLYHVDKTSIINNSTKNLQKPWTWVNDEGELSYNANKVDKLVLVGYSSKLTPEDMKDICKNLSTDRTFNTLTNNCQKWVESVLAELVNTGHLHKLCLEELQTDNEIIPLLGWISRMWYIYYAYA
jgi:hypothetical protein